MEIPVLLDFFGLETISEIKAARKSSFTGFILLIFELSTNKTSLTLISDIRAKRR